LGKRIKITSPSIGEVYAQLSSENPTTANAIWKSLPLDARVNTWGDEVYFSISVQLDEEHSKEVVELGEIAYWPPGHALCIFFGPTPSSRGGDIRPASPVSVIGRIEGDPGVFKKVRDGEMIRLMPS